MVFVQANCEVAVAESTITLIPRAHENGVLSSCSGPIGSVPERVFIYYWFFKCLYRHIWLLIEVADKETETYNPAFKQTLGSGVGDTSNYTDVSKKYFWMRVAWMSRESKMYSMSTVCRFWYSKVPTDFARIRINQHTLAACQLKALFILWIAHVAQNTDLPRFLCKANVIEM